MSKNYEEKKNMKTLIQFSCVFDCILIHIYILFIFQLQMFGFYFIYKKKTVLFYSNKIKIYEEK